MFSWIECCPRSSAGFTARARHDVPVVIVFVFATVISLIGAAVWIGLLIWAAKADGQEQQQHEQDIERGDPDR